MSDVRGEISVLWASPHTTELPCYVAAPTHRCFSSVPGGELPSAPQEQCPGSSVNSNPRLTSLPLEESCGDAPRQGPQTPVGRETCCLTNLHVSSDIQAVVFSGLYPTTKKCGKDQSETDKDKPPTE